MTSIGRGGGESITNPLNHHKENVWGAELHKKGKMSKLLIEIIKKRYEFHFQLYSRIIIDCFKNTQSII